MPSRTIRPTEAPAAAPFAYTIGAADGLAPEAVFAQWDGTGAGGDFLPCVSYYNADGVLLDRAFPTTGPVAAGDTAEVSYRPFERGGSAASAAIDITDGVTTINPATTLRIGAFLQLFDFGGGVAFVRGVAPPTLPPVLRALFDVFSQANAQPPISTFPIFSSRNDNGAVVVVGGQAFFDFRQTFAQRMTVQGVIQNPTGATITAQLFGHTSVSPPVVGFPFTTVVQHVPPGGERPLPLVLRDLAPGSFSDGWLEFTAVDEGTGLPIAGVQLTGEIAFLET